MPPAPRWFSIAFILIVYLGRILELGAKRDVLAGRVKEKWTLRLFLFCGTGMLAGSITEFILRQPEWNWWIFSLGAGCAIGSFAIRRRAIVALGRFWSLHNEIRENHSFVQSGPFKWVRHPTYLSM